MGTLAKAKANASQGIPQLIQTAKNPRFKENLAVKHKVDAKYGWYRYTARFALLVYGETEDVERYNVFRVEVLIRHSKDGNKYLYDLVNKKKKRAPRLNLKVVRLQTHFFDTILLVRQVVVNEKVAVLQASV